MRRLFSYEKERFVALFMAKTNLIFRPRGDENGLLFRFPTGCFSAPKGCVSASKGVVFPLQAGDENTAKTTQKTTQAGNENDKKTKKFSIYI